MHAADVIEPLPTAGLDDAVLSAARMVSEHGLPGLAVVDEQHHLVACVSSVDLLSLAVPGYLRDDPGLAAVFDEGYSDTIAAVLVGTRIRDVVSRVADRVPVARSRATLVELAEMMTRRCSPLVMVEQEGRALGIVTVNRLLAVLVAAVGDAPR